MYVDYEFYSELYGKKAIEESVFNLLSWETCKKVDYYTTGVDGVKKLKHFFPADEDDAESVKRCICKLIDTMNQINLAEEEEKNAQGYIIREDGSLQGKVVSSISAGNESMSYSIGKSGTTQISNAVSDSSAREKLYRDIVTEYLSGVTDSNGVNLLYMGAYPKERMTV